MKAVEKLMTARSAVDNQKTTYVSSRRGFFMGITPSAKIEKTDKSPKAMPRSVHLPIGLEVVVVKIPQIGDPPNRILIVVNTATKEIETKKALEALSNFEVSVKIRLIRINRIETRSMKPKVPTSKLYPKSERADGVLKYAETK